MEKFTGADLTEICQRAAKIAIRENIMKVSFLFFVSILIGPDFDFV